LALCVDSSARGTLRHVQSTAERYRAAADGFQWALRLANRPFLTQFEPIEPGNHPGAG
jgi:hypothetical protein